MDDETRDNSYETFREAAEEYGEEKGHDLLTDPDAMAAVEESSAKDASISHGQRVRSGREAQGFTVEELGSKTGIDPALIEQLEKGETYLPLGQLIRLSKALSLKMSDVIAHGEQAFTVVRADQRRSFSRFGKSKEASHGYEYESLAPDKKDRSMEPFVVTLHPSASDEPSSHDGQEFIYVLDGEMEVIVDEYRDVLKAGDSVYYDSTSMHLVRAHGDKPARILAVLVS